MKKVLFGIVILLAAAGLPFAGGSKEAKAEQAAGDFSGSWTFGGSTTVLPIMESAIEEFTSLHPDVDITYEAPGSSAGVTGVIDGVYSLGGSSRELEEEEIAGGCRPIPIALDGIAIIVNGNVGVADLTLEQAAKIYTGRITSWKEVGGADRPIVVVNRDEASGTRAAFLELVLQKVAGKEAGFRMDAITVESNGDMVTKVGATPDAIGYCGFGYVDKARNAGAREVSVNGMEVTMQNVVDRKYPVSRHLFALHEGDLEDGTLEKAFVDFLLSPAGRAIVKNEGFIALP